MFKEKKVVARLSYQRNTGVVRHINLTDDDLCRVSLDLQNKELMVSVESENVSINSSRIIEIQIKK